MLFFLTLTSVQGETDRGDNRFVVLGTLGGWGGCRVMLCLWWQDGLQQCQDPRQTRNEQADQNQREKHDRKAGDGNPQALVIDDVLKSIDDVLKSELLGENHLVAEMSGETVAGDFGETNESPRLTRPGHRVEGPSGPAKSRPNPGNQAVFGICGTTGNDEIAAAKADPLVKVDDAT